ncbi:MAG: MoaD/ThiS family protein [Pedosphaera sp.]|nr:MoaD/ThiS family protein [Pedosphaera sp.]
MRVSVKLFAEFRRLTGLDRCDVEVPPSATVGDVVEAVRARFPALRNYDKHTLVAKGVEFAEAQETVSEGDEISLMPPVMGG